MESVEEEPQELFSIFLESTLVVSESLERELGPFNHR